MKKLATLVTAFLLIAGLASAQTGDTTFHKHFGGRKMAAQRHGDRQQFAQKLNLTDEQKAQMKTANEDFRKQAKDLRSNDKLTLGEYKQKMADLQKSHRAKVQGIFTDEQKKTLAEGRKNMQKRGHARQGQHGAGIEKMKQQLNLTDEQAAALKTKREQLRTQMQSLRSDSTLAPEQKKEKMKELFAKQKDDLKSVLTPEQLNKFQELRKNRMHGRRNGEINDQSK